jgi:hypothetical protein
MTKKIKNFGIEVNVQTGEVTEVEIVDETTPE